MTSITITTSSALIGAFALLAFVTQGVVALDVKQAAQIEAIGLTQHVEVQRYLQMESFRKVSGL